MFGLEGVNTYSDSYLHDAVARPSFSGKIDSRQLEEEPSVPPPPPPMEHVHFHQKKSDKSTILNYCILYVILHSL